MGDFEMYGPFDVELKVHVTDGEQTAVATYEMGRSQYVTPEKVQEALLTVEAQIQEQMPGQGWRLCTKPEYFDQMMLEKTGQRFALPGKDEWDVFDG